MVRGALGPARLDYNTACTRVSTEAASLLMLDLHLSVSTAANTSACNVDIHWSHIAIGVS